MHHPEFLLIPVLMVADYLLTIRNAKTKEVSYARNFKHEHHELNPIWQKDVAKLRWFNPRHLVLVASFILIFIPLIEFGELPEGFVKGVAGALFAAYACIIGRHCANSLTFRYHFRNQIEVSGEVTVAHRYIVAISFYQILPALFPVVIVAVLSRSEVSIGAAIGVLLVFGVHYMWLIKAKRVKLPQMGNPAIADNCKT